MDKAAKLKEIKKSFSNLASEIKDLNEEDLSSQLIKSQIEQLESLIGEFSQLSDVEIKFEKTAETKLQELKMVKIFLRNIMGKDYGIYNEYHKLIRDGSSGMQVCKKGFFNRRKVMRFIFSPKEGNSITIEGIEEDKQLIEYVIAQAKSQGFNFKIINH